MDKLAELAAQYAPHVIQASRDAVMVEVYSQFAGAAVCLATGLLCLYASWWCFKANRIDPYSDWWLPAGAAGVLGAALILPALWTIVDPWTWAAIYHPDLWIAKKVLHL